MSPAVLVTGMGLALPALGVAVPQQLWHRLLHPAPTPAPIQPINAELVVIAIERALVDANSPSESSLISPGRNSVPVFLCATGLPDLASNLVPAVGFECESHSCTAAALTSAMDRLHHGCPRVVVAAANNVCSVESLGSLLGAIALVLELSTSPAQDLLAYGMLDPPSGLQMMIPATVAFFAPFPSFEAPPLPGNTPLTTLGTALGYGGPASLGPALALATALLASGNRTFPGQSASAVQAARCQYRKSGPWSPSFSRPWSDGESALVLMLGANEGTTYFVVKPVDRKSDPVDILPTGLANNSMGLPLAFCGGWSQSNIGRNALDKMPAPESGVTARLWMQQNLESLGNEPVGGFVARLPDGDCVREVARPSSSPLCVVFAGLGSAWLGMGAPLMHLGPARRSLLESQTVTKKNLSLDLLGLLVDSKNESMLQNAGAAFVCIVAIEMALWDLHIAAGLDAASVNFLGHSAGELACAYACGCATREETIVAAYTVARTASLVATGGMVAIDETPADVPCGIFLACDHGAAGCTLAGDQKILEELLTLHKNRGGLACQVPSGNVPFHSPLLQTHVEILSHAVSQAWSQLDRKKCRAVLGQDRPARWYSSSGQEGQMFDADYVARNVCKRVDWAHTLLLLPAGTQVLELSPHAILSPLVTKLQPAWPIPWASYSRQFRNPLACPAVSLGRCVGAGYSHFAAGKWLSVVCPDAEWRRAKILPHHQADASAAGNMHCRSASGSIVYCIQVHERGISFGSLVEIAGKCVEDTCRCIGLVKRPQTWDISDFEGSIFPMSGSIQVTVKFPNSRNDIIEVLLATGDLKSKEDCQNICQRMVFLGRNWEDCSKTAISWKSVSAALHAVNRSSSISNIHATEDGALVSEKSSLSTWFALGFQKMHRIWSKIGKTALGK